jgi:hypothetical protein
LWEIFMDRNYIFIEQWPDQNLFVLTVSVLHKKSIY